LLCHFRTDPPQVVDVFDGVEFLDILGLDVVQTHRIQAFAAQICVAAGVEKPAVKILAERNPFSVGNTCNHVTDFTVQNSAVHATVDETTIGILIGQGESVVRLRVTASSKHSRSSGFKVI
ncbi:MAG: hypothetical protein PVG08_20270, partial [Desulfobacterales bacterium]